VSLIDFGLSRILQISGFTTKTISGTSRYVALELLKEEFTPRVTAATDTWALAMTVIEVRVCRPAYFGDGAHITAYRSSPRTNHSPISKTTTRS
jgi:serine/threonine protein kinase